MGGRFATRELSATVAAGDGAYVVHPSPSGARHTRTAGSVSLEKVCRGANEAHAMHWHGEFAIILAREVRGTVVWIVSCGTHHAYKRCLSHLARILHAFECRRGGGMVKRYRELTETFVK